MLEDEAQKDETNISCLAAEFGQVSQAALKVSTRLVEGIDNLGRVFWVLSFLLTALPLSAVDLGPA